jgi:predicted Zn finger-like uncharacterized protein
MPLVIHCPSCTKRYEVADTMRGKRVRCQQCGNVFTAASAAASAPAPPVISEPLDQLAGVDLSQLPAMPALPPLGSSTNPLGKTGISAPAYVPARSNAASARISNPSGGPTDLQMRLACCGMLALGIAIIVGSLALEATQGTVYLGILILAPLMLVLGVAGLISPNVVRAVGKYGGHLPWHYKAIGWGVMALCFLLMILLMIGLFAAGFQPDRPGSRNQTPGLTRSQTATVLERIRKSYEASRNADVVRTVSFPVFSIHGPSPESDAERVLSPVPGYVAGSFQLSADQKTASFRYKGDKEIANQYALLLPGPTGVFIAFTPTFEQ